MILQFLSVSSGGAIQHRPGWNERSEAEWMKPLLCSVHHAELRRSDTELYNIWWWQYTAPPILSSWNFTAYNRGFSRFAPFTTAYVVMKVYQNERSALSRRNHTNLPKSNKLIFKRLFCMIWKDLQDFSPLGDFFNYWYTFNPSATAVPEGRNKLGRGERSKATETPVMGVGSREPGYGRHRA